MGSDEYSRWVAAWRDAQWRARTLADVVDDAVLRAASAQRKRRLVQEAWRRVALPEWQGVARVESVEQGVALVVVSEPVRYEELRRQARELGRELAGLVPGLRGLRFMPAAAQDVQPGDWRLR